MRAILLATLCLALSAPAPGSPIQEPVTSLDHLKSIGATVETDEYEDGSGISIQVSWRPADNNDEAFPPRMDLVLTAKRSADQTVQQRTRLQVRFTESVDGILSADFTISSGDLENAQLWFRESQNLSYFLNINDLHKGFPDSNLDPFAEKRSGEQAGTEQPATLPESKSEGDDKPQPEAEGRPR